MYLYWVSYVFEKELENGMEETFEIFHITEEYITDFDSGESR